jgi:hypothetical protein
MAHYMHNHLSFEKINDLAREYFFYPFQPSGPLCRRKESLLTQPKEISSDFACCCLLVACQGKICLSLVTLPIGRPGYGRSQGVIGVF